MQEAQTASERMLENQNANLSNITKKLELDFVLPSGNVQKFLLEVVEQHSYPGNMVEFVSAVKVMLKNAVIKQS